MYHCVSSKLLFSEFFFPTLNVYWSGFFDKLDINNCILSVGHVRKKMEMLENNQQDTESRTALVEDRMDVVEDRVNVAEDSVYHLQGNLLIF